jgi:hypothetical protein
MHVRDSPLRNVRSTGTVQCPRSRSYLPGFAVSPVAGPLPVRAPRCRRVRRRRPRRRAPPCTVTEALSPGFDRLGRGPDRWRLRLPVGPIARPLPVWQRCHGASTGTAGAQTRTCGGSVAGPADQQSGWQCSSCLHLLLLVQGLGRCSHHSTTQTVRAAAQVFSHNSRTGVSKVLVRILKLSLKVLDVVLFVAQESCALRPPKHQLTLSLDPIQVRLHRGADPCRLRAHHADYADFQTFRDHRKQNLRVSIQRGGGWNKTY